MVKKSFKVFVRNWYKPNPEWPNGLEPDGNARRTTIGSAETEEQARQMAQAYNDAHDAGRLARKAEFTSNI